MNRINLNDNPHLERDLTNHAVINNNNSGYQARLEQIKRTQSREDEIQEIKSDIAEIKELLKNLGGK